MSRETTKVRRSLCWKGQTSLFHTLLGYQEEGPGRLDEAESTVDVFSRGLRRAFSHPHGRPRGPKMSAHQRTRHVLSGSLAGRQMALVFCSCESQISHSAGRLRFSRADPSVRTSEFRKSQLCRSVAPLAATSDLFNVSLHLRGKHQTFCRSYVMLVDIHWLEKNAYFILYSNGLNELFPWILRRHLRLEFVPPLQGLRFDHIKRQRPESVCL